MNTTAATTTLTTGLGSVHAGSARRGLVRPDQGRVLAGVCSGIAAKYGMNTWAVRALVVVSMLVLPGSQALLYPLAWLLMPSQDQARRVLDAQAAPTAAPTMPIVPTTTAGPQDAVVR